MAITGTRTAAATLATLLGALALAGCRTTDAWSPGPVAGAAPDAGVEPVAAEPAFPLRIEAAVAKGRYLAVDYTLTNDSGADVWAACPEYACALPGTWAARVDGLTADGAVLRLSSRLVARDAAAFATHAELVPFRRVPPGTSRWRAEFDLPVDAARAIAEAKGRVRVELAIGILPCGEREPAAAHEVAGAPGVRVVQRTLVLDCAGEHRPVLELQRLTGGGRALEVARR